MALRKFLELEAAMARTGLYQYEIQFHTQTSRLPKIRTGAVEPTSGERSRLAEFLGVPEEILFQERTEEPVRRDVHVDESELLEHMTTVSPDGSVRP